MSDSVKSGDSSGDGSRCRDEADLTDSFCTIWSLVLMFLDENHFDDWHVLSSEHPEVTQTKGDRHSLDAGELLGQRIAEPHMNSSLDLSFTQVGVDDTSNVMSGDHAL